MSRTLESITALALFGLRARLATVLDIQYFARSDSVSATASHTTLNPFLYTSMLCVASCWVSTQSPAPTKWAHTSPSVAVHISRYWSMASTILGAQSSYTASTVTARVALAIISGLFDFFATRISACNPPLCVRDRRKESSDARYGTRAGMYSCISSDDRRNFIRGSKPLAAMNRCTAVLSPRASTWRYLATISLSRCFGDCSCLMTWAKTSGGEMLSSVIVSRFLPARRDEGCEGSGSRDLK
mmetsp:Transcript_86550/g.232035  ORF Transcript_86550/g.232035 Transcript_86550/m.232035 type:complete len:243 (+) Transcript_86550:3875-4603(+)